MKCINCGCELNEDCKFCKNCGAKQLKTAVEEWSKIEKDTKEKIEELGVEKPKGMERFVPVKRKMWKNLVIAAMVVVVIASVIAGGVRCFFKNEERYVLYMKDDSIYQLNVNQYKKKPIEYGSNCEYRGSYMEEKYSEDGKYIFYTTDVEEEGDRQLCMQKVGGKDTRKIDNNVYRYTILKNNSVVYRNAEGLYIYITNLGKKEEIASDVIEYYIDENEKMVAWTKGEENMSLYYLNLDLKNKEKEIVKDAKNINVGENLRQIVVQTENELFVISNLKEKEKIDSEGGIVLYNDEEGGNVYYLKNKEEILKAKDLVEDDYKEWDASVEKPNPVDFWTTGYGGYDTFEYETYGEAEDEYDEKKVRDEIRKMLESIEIPQKELCCYSQGTTTMVDEDFLCPCVGAGSPMTIYKRYDTEKIEKINISELISKLQEVYEVYEIEESNEEVITEIEGICDEVIENTATTCVCMKDEAIETGESLENCIYNKEGDIVYGLKYEYNDEDHEEQGASLFAFYVKGGNAGECKQFDEGVDSIEMVAGSKVYYIKAEDGDLYCNGEKIDSNVMSGSLREEDKIYYFTDYDDEEANAVLKVYDGKKSKKIAEDVHEYKIFNDNQIVALVDYNLESNKGELKLYRGEKELSMLDDGVSYIFDANRVNYW